jgi:hypothetical protein
MRAIFLRRRKLGCTSCREIAGYMRTYWHFLNEDRRLANGDGRKVKVGETYRVEGQPQLCHRGLHASKRLIDALFYAPGPVLCKVQLGGVVVHGDDKAVATERTVLAMADVTDILRAFARKTAAEVWFQHFERGEHPEVDRWLDSGGDEIARSAAESAARSAARSAVWSAAESAVRSAARSAANRRLLEMVRKAQWETA